MMSPFFPVDERVEQAARRALDAAQQQFDSIDAIRTHNQEKVLAAFIKNGVTESHFTESTGYGYGDRGREVLDRVLADAVGSQDALIRHSLTCGTHTLCVALFGVLRPGDTMLCVTGTPYDTIHGVIGLRGSGMGSLKEFGVSYRQTELGANGKPDLDAIERELTEHKIAMVYIQRSRGYSLRPSLSVEDIEQIAALVHEKSDAILMVDNCYGEFVQLTEPVSHGADLIAGSLIKNPGGAIAKCGGYIAGRADLIEQCAYRMTTPGLGREVGPSLGQNRGLFMGLFNAPHIVGEALKTAVFAAALFREFGFEATPAFDEKRCDIIQALKLRTSENLIAFCQGMQKGAPIDSTVVPEPWDMPGYDSQVIMSAGAFTGGSSIELSSDAPLREPFAVWMQGSMNFDSGKIGVMLAAQELVNRGLV